MNVALRVLEVLLSVELLLLKLLLLGQLLRLTHTRAYVVLELLLVAQLVKLLEEQLRV